MYQEIAQARFEWAIVLIGFGILVYFALPTEPSILALTFCLIAFAAGYVAFGRYQAVSTMCACALLISLGLFRAAHHTQSLSTPTLPDYERYYSVSGWIESTRTSGPFESWTIRVHEFSGRGEKPKRIRVRLKNPGFHPGDGVQFAAILQAPPRPALAGGYDSARAAYFANIAGTGFGVKTPEVYEIADMNMRERLARKIVTARFALSRHIQTRAPPETAGLQSALLTGDRSGIPQEQEDVLRDAGLAHMLAISGLHMGLLAGGAYALASFAFSCIPALAGRYDMRKWAAAIGIALACVYLVMSGASVSTQRAFIMAVVAFGAIIADRRAVSLRSVALAALITLMLHPESLLSAGFQMSFAATTALVVVFRYWSDRRDFSVQRSFIAKTKSGFAGLVITSFVAGLATGGLAALHFHRFARYGFLTNILAMGVFSLIVMPFGFIALLLMPFGLDGFAFQIMGWGLDYIIAVSKWVTGFQGAVWYLKAAHPLAIPVYGLGVIALCLGRAGIRTIAIGLIIGAGVIWTLTPQADLRVSSEGRVAFWMPDNPNVLNIDSSRADRFGRSRFAEQAGRPAASFMPFEDTLVPCDQLMCLIALKGQTIAIVETPEGADEACQIAGIVIVVERSVGPVVRRACKAMLIDSRDLKAGGAVDIAIKDGTARLRYARPKQGSRPWHSQMR